MAKADSEEEDVGAIHRALSGDAQAFRFLVLKYADRMLAFCRSRSACEEDAADAAQESFARAFRSLPSFKLGSSFAAWLFAIAANRTRTGWSRRRTDRSKAERAGLEETAREATDPEAEALRRIEAERVRLAVSDLPHDLRISVELYYFAELSVGEAAQTLRVGEETMKSRLFRARKKLRIAFEERNRAGSDGVL